MEVVMEVMEVMEVLEVVEVGRWRLCDPVSPSLCGREILSVPRAGPHWAPEKVLYYATEAREA